MVFSKFAKNIIVGTISIIFSIPILFICEIIHIKIIYFSLCFILINLIFYILQHNDKYFKIQVNSINKIELLLSVFLITISIFFLFYDILGLNIPRIISTVFSLIFASFLPGYSLIKILKIEKGFSYTSKLVFSFIISYIVSGLLWLLFIILNIGFKKNLINIIYLFLAFFVLIKNCNARNSIGLKKSIKFSKLTTFGILFCLFYYAISFLIIYPEFSLIKGIDIVRHYEWTYTLTFDKQNYEHIVYLLFHSFQSIFFTFSNNSYVYSESTLVFINLLLPISFFLLAKLLLEKKDLKIPILSTLIFTFLLSLEGSVMWIIVLGQKIITQNSQIEILTELGRAAQYSVLGLWFTPLHLNLIILFSLLYLFVNKQITKKPLIMLSTLLIYSLFLNHIAEGTIFFLFLSLYIITSHKSSFRMKEIISASILGAFFSFSTLYIIASEKLFSTNVVISIQITISILGSLFILLVSKMVKDRLAKNTNIYPRIYGFLKSNKLRKIVLFSLIALLGYHFFGLIYCLSYRFSFSQKCNIFNFFESFSFATLPILFLVLSCYFLISNKIHDENFYFSIIFIIFCFGFGRLITFVNNYVIFTGYIEYRVIILGIVFIAFNSPVVLIYLTKKIKLNYKWISETKITINIILISFICLMGFSIIPLNIEFWYLYANNSNNTYSETYFYPITFYDQQGWYNHSGRDCHIKTIEELDGHRNIIEIFDGNEKELAKIQRFFRPIIEGRLEFNIRTTNATKYIGLFLYDKNIWNSITICILNSKIYYYYDTQWHNITKLNSNQWYHLTIDFNLNSVWGLEIDGFYYSQFEFRGQPIALKAFMLITDTSQKNYYCYLDSFNISIG